MTDQPPARRRGARRIAAAGLRAAGRAHALWSALLTGAVAAAAMLAVGAEGQRLEGPSALLFDSFQRAAPRSYDPETPVRVVAIDGESLRRYGQWPWPRTYFIELLDRLEALQSPAVVFDILFADADRTSPELVSEAARRFDRASPPAPAVAVVATHDAMLARRIATGRVVLGALPVPEGGAPFTPKAGFSMQGSDATAGLIAYSAVEPPLRPFIDNAAGYGLTGVGVGGGVARRATMVARVGGTVAPSLAFEALRVAQDARGYLLRASDASGEGGGGAPALVAARVGGLVAPLAPDGAIWLRYAGPAPERVVPAWRVLEGDAPPPDVAAALAGRIALIGATAPGLRYVVDTPLAPAVDGVIVQAETLEQLIAGAHLTRPDWAVGAELAAVGAAALAAFLLIRRRGPVAGALVAAGGVGLLLWSGWRAFTGADLILSPVWPAATLAVSYVGLTAQNYLAASRQSRAVRAQFERFVAPEVISELVEHPERTARLRGELRELTVMFVDVRGFTGLTEDMPPERLIAYLNAVLGEVSECVLASGGTVDKYMGDCVMAFWNAPLSLPAHAARAVGTLFAIRAAQERLNARFAADGLRPVRLGAGVSTGVCNVGLMGSPRRLDYSCIGDAANIASRIQDLTKSFGVWNCVGDATVAAAPGWCAVELDDAPIRGRKRAERVWTLLGPASREADPAVAALRAALAEARAGARALAAGDGPEALLVAADAIAAIELPDVDVAQLARRFREKATG